MKPATSEKSQTRFYRPQNNHFAANRNSRVPKQSPITNQQHNQEKTRKSRATEKNNERT